MRRALKIISIFLGIIGLTTTCFAAVPDIPRPDFLPGTDLQGGSLFIDYLLNDRLPRAINIGVGILGISAFIAIIVAAITMLTSWGEEETLNRAKRNFRYAVTGFLVIIFSYAIVSIAVSVSFPDNSETSHHFELIPTAHAVSVDDLIPPQQTLIEDQDVQNRVQLPTGDFLKEILPGFIVNILYITGFLIFISLIVAGVILIFGWGNEESNTQAKRILIYGAYAIALLALGYALIFGISKINFSETDNSNDDLYTTSILHTDFAVVQLDPDLKPNSIPDYESEDPLDSDHPETAATQTLLLKIGNLITKVLLFTASLAIIYLIIAGANYIFAFGKDERIEKARRGIFWSITGLLIILLSYAITRGLVSILLQTDASVR